MKTLQRFKADNRGTTAVIFGLAILPVMALVGGAVDFSRASAARTAMQKAVDATAIALVRDSASLSDRQLQQRGAAVFGAVFQPGAGIEAAPVKVSRDSRTIRVAASGTVRTSIMGVLGFDHMDIASSAESTWGVKRIELALVLDNTGSMSRLNKMDELKAAAKDLLDKMQDASAHLDRDAIKISIVPFDTQVRLDASSYRSAAWLEPTGIKRNKWDGYVTDRAQPYDVNDTAPDSRDPKTLYPMVESDGGTLATLQPLTSDFVALRKTINAMQPRGCTNITMGASWGLASLSPAEPLGGAVAFGTQDVEKIMILLTDGLNTRSRDYVAPKGGCPEGTAVGTAINKRTEKACDAVKATGIRVYTVRVIEGDQDLLKGCASKATDGTPLYKEVQAASELTSTFREIVNSILATRLTH